MVARDNAAHSAIFFMGEKGVQRHMLFSEFEALLSGHVALSDCKDEDVKAIYVVINPFGKITALVFFTIYFDDQGCADASWNIPIERLADISGRGPDLGAGPIRLSCRSQCAINWHQNDLWDPDMTPGTNDFLKVRKAVEANRLCFKFESEPEDIPVLESAEPPVVGGGDPDLDLNVDKAKRVKLARLLKEQRLRIRTLESNREQGNEELDREQRIIIHAYKNEIQSLKQSAEQLKVQNEKLQEKLSSRNAEYIDLQDKVSGQGEKVAELEKRLSTASGSERADIERQKLEAELVLVREQLERRNAELAHRDEREELLRLELEEFKETHLNSEKSEDILDKLAELEVVYTAYHPGIGHVTMGNTEIRLYAENPIAFVAARCYITEEQYSAWLLHHENPACTHVDEHGSKCLAPIKKIESPNDFELGLDDRCPLHKPEGFS